MCQENDNIEAAKRAFSRACAIMLTHDHAENGIGTLGEKSLHSTIKRYLSKDESTHEIKCGRYVADICAEGAIFEVQTRGFEHLRKKLEFFLPSYKVTVVHPIPAKKWVVKMNRHTGECGEKRKSPKKCGVFSVFPELYKIRQFVKHESFALRLLLLEVTDYRITSGNPKDRGERFERMPSALLEDITLHTPKDYQALLPQSLPSPFTSKDLAKEAKIPLGEAQHALLVLTDIGAVERIGKQGNAYLYEKCVFSASDNTQCIAALRLHELC